MEESAEALIVVTIGAGSHTTTSILASDATSYATGELVGRHGTFKSGTAAGQQCKITANTNGTGAMTVEDNDGNALTTAPAENDVMVIH